MSLTVPFRTSSQPPGHGSGDGSLDVPPVPSRREVGAFELRSVAVYLLIWTVVVFLVEVLVLWTSHVALERLGVLGSVSRAVATVLGDEVPATGVLPALEIDALMPWLLAVAGALALLWLLTLLAVVLVHNGICALTGGPHVGVRPLG